MAHSSQTARIPEGEETRELVIKQGTVTEVSTMYWRSAEDQHFTPDSAYLGGAGMGKLPEGSNPKRGAIKAGKGTILEAVSGAPWPQPGSPGE